MAYGVPVTGQSLTTEIGQGWGKLAWGSGLWGGVSLTITIEQTLTATGTQISTALGTETMTGDANITLTGVTALSSSIGSPTYISDTTASPAGVSLSANLGTETVDAQVRHGWGRLGWGQGGWGQPADGTYGVTGVSMATALADVRSYFTC